MKPLFLLFVVGLWSSSIAAQSLAKLEQLLNKELSTALKQPALNGKLTGEMVQAVAPFTIKDDTLRLTVKKSEKGSEDYTLEEQRVALRHLVSLGLDGMLLFNTREPVALTTTVYAGGKTDRYTAMVPHCWLYIGMGKRTEKLQQQIIDLLSKAGYPIVAVSQID